jgi:hypothetical protein
MSTRCRIGIKNEDGTITSIYCHHDGYVSYVGKTLFDSYKDEAKIRKLLELGDMSSLGTEPVDNPRAWESTSSAVLDPEAWSKLYAEVHPEDMCDTYKSRGEDCPARKSKDEKAYEKLVDDCWGEYAYLFKDGKWFVSPYGEGFRDLETELKKDREAN